MNLKQIKLFLLAFGLIGLSGIAVAEHEALQRYSITVEKPFDEVIEDIEFAIAEYNYRITGRNNIGSAIAKREEIDFPQATAIHFCNLEYARRFLEIAPDSLMQMPCLIGVREQGDKVIVEARLLPEDDPRLKDLNIEVNGILKAIVDFVLE